MKTHIIYIPGLGDDYDSFRRICLKGWSLLGASTELVPIRWYDGGDFDQKYNYVSDAVGRSANTDKRIVLIGESAGASLALLIAKAEPDTIARVVTLCGVASGDTPISENLRRQAPSLQTAVSKIAGQMHHDIHSVRAIADPTVNKRYSVAKGATPHVIWSVGHLTTIALCLTMLSPLMVKIAKSIKK